MKETTINQRTSEYKKYFGPNESFSHAMKLLQELKTVVQKSNHANKVASIMNLLPEVCPSKKEYDLFKNQQKEWNQEKNAHYKNKKEPALSQKQMRSLEQRCEELKQEANTKKRIEAYLLCALISQLSIDDLNAFEVADITMKQVGSGRKQCYINEKNQLVIWDIQKKRSRKIRLNESITEKMSLLRTLDGNKLYLFGGETKLSQPAFSILWNNVFDMSKHNVMKLKQLQT